MSQPARSHWRRKKWVLNLRLKRWLPYVPAILALLFWPLVAVLAMRNTDAVEKRYIAYADRALARGDYQEARIPCERLLAMDSGQRPFHMYRMALCLAGLGQRDASLQLLGALASEDSPMFSQAHRAIAEMILGDPESDASALKVAEYHLKTALSVGDASAPKLLEMLGQLHGRRKEWDQAREYFARAYRTNPGMALPLAALAQAQGRNAETLRWAGEAVTYFEAQTKRFEGDVASRQSWAQSLLLLGQYTNALAVVNAGLKERDVPAYHKLAAEIIAAWLQTTKSAAPDTLAWRLNLLEQGLVHDPNNHALLRELIAASNLQGPQAATARALLNRMLARGDAAAAVRFCLGMDAWRSGNLAECRQHFEIIFKQYPLMSAVANNLAWLLTFGEPHDYERALEIMNSVVQRHPDSPAFRETRGQVLVKLGRWSDAVADLDYSLPWYRDSATTHAALAEAYRGLGMTNLATEHQRLAAKPPGR